MTYCNTSLDYPNVPHKIFKACGIFPTIAVANTCQPVCNHRCTYKQWDNYNQCLQAELDELRNRLNAGREAIRERHLAKERSKREAEQASLRAQQQEQSAKEGVSKSAGKKGKKKWDVCPVTMYEHVIIVRYLTVEYHVLCSAIVYLLRHTIQVYTHWFIIKYIVMKKLI